MGNTFTQKSDETWRDGNDCLDRGLINLAANRIYYSVLQAIKGFAVEKKGWSVHDSDNVHVKALNIICGSGGGKGHGFRRRFSELRALRITADYYPEDVDAQELKALVNDADMIRMHHIKNAG